MIETGLVAYVIGLDSVRKLIDSRMKPLTTKQGVGFPRIIYQLIDYHDYQGIAGGVGAGNATYQLECQGASYNDAKAITDALYDKLNGYRGPMGSFVCQRAKCSRVYDGYDEPIFSNDIGVYVRQFDVTIIFDQSPPSVAGQ